MARLIAIPKPSGIDFKCAPLCPASRKKEVHDCSMDFWVSTGYGDSQRTQIVSSPVPQSHCGRRLRAVPGRQRKRPTYDSPFHPACRGKGNHGNMFSRLPPVVVTSHHYNSYSSRSASQERPLGGAPSERPQKDPQSGPGAPKPKTHQCCSKLILERPRLRSAPLGASLGLLGLPGRLLGPPAASWVPPVAKLGNNLSPRAHPPTADVTTITSGLQGPSMQSTRSTLAWMKNTSKSTWTWRVIRTRPRLRSAPLFMDLTCFNTRSQSKQRRGDLGTTVWAPSVAQHSAVRSRKGPTS